MFDIKAGDLNAGLMAYAAQSGAQLIYKAEDVKGRVTKGIHKEALPAEALRDLLEGTALSVRIDASGAMVIFVVPAGSTEHRGEAPADALQTVTVSATRRNEPVRQIPMQVNVVDAEDVARTGARGLRDYMSNEPGVSVNSFGGAMSNDVSIRGVSTGSQTVATVGIYVDDVATGSSSAYVNGSRTALNLALLDLNHIEILRGPQGTLYGAGAMGGVLKYVTNEPQSDEFGGSVTLSSSFVEGAGANGTLSGVLNLPLREGVAAARVAAFKDHQSGSVDSVGAVSRSDVDSGGSTGARASILITPVRQLTVRLTAMTQKTNRAGNDYVDYGPATRQPVEGARTRSLNIAEPGASRVNLYSADVEVELGWARLNSVTTYQRQLLSTMTDYSAVYVPVLKAAGLNFESVGLANRTVQRKETQEFRLTSRSDKHFEWLAGAYINHERGEGDQQTSSVPAAGTADLNLATFSLPSDYREAAAYGDATWKITSDFSVTAGARIARNRQRFEQTTSGVLAGPGSHQQGRSSDTSKLWLLTAGYALDAGNSVYLRGASGYRPGGPNLVTPDADGDPTAPPTFRPDTLTSFEAGYKGSLLGKTLQVEASLYRLDWHDIQQYQIVNGVSVIVNAGKAAINGAELTLTYRPTQSWIMTASGALIRARLTQDAPGLGATSGQRLPGSARLSASASATYRFALVSQAAYIGASTQYVGQRNSGFDSSSSSPNYRLPSYSLTDLQAGVEFKTMSVGLYVRNAFDAQAQQGVNALPELYGGPAWVTLAPSRTFGISVNVPW